MEEKEPDKINMNQEQIHNVLFSKETGWKDIIYDLINTEQLDPWNVDIIILSDKYLEKISDFEEADFFVSSKVLLAASFLLRIKSEILLNKHLKSIDEILFGKEEKKKYSLERIESNEEIPELIPKSPMPRFKKVTLKELIESLNRAITTENRRIQKVMINKNALRETNIVLSEKRFNIKNRIKEIYEKLSKYFRENEYKRISYTEFIGKDKNERLISFVPLLHLESQQKIWLEQEKPFDEINIWLKKEYLKHNSSIFSELEEENEKE
jgi:segregation and condensation protein A